MKMVDDITTPTITYKSRDMVASSSKGPKPGPTGDDFNKKRSAEQAANRKSEERDQRVRGGWKGVMKEESWRLKFRAHAQPG